MGDEQGGPLGVQHQADERLQLEMPREAAESTDAGRKRMSHQWSQIYRNREKLLLPQSWQSVIG